MAQEFIADGKKSKDFGYSHLKVPSKKTPSKERKCCLHTDEVPWSKKELGLRELLLRTIKQQNEVCLLLRFGECLGDKQCL